MLLKDKETGEISTRDVTLEQDEGIRPETTFESISSLKPVFKGGQALEPGGSVTARDGSSRGG